MKKKLILYFAVAAALLGLLGATACSSGGQSGVTQQPYTVERGDVEIGANGTGKIETSQEARLTFGSGGKVAQILVEEGDKVTAGEVLARLDTSPLELALNQSRMTLTQSEVALTQAKLSLQIAEYALEDTRDSADSLELALLNAQISRDAAQRDLDSNITSLDYYAIEAELNKARAWYDYVKRMASEATTGLDDWDLALDRAADNLKIAQANYDNILAGYDSSQVQLKKKQLAAAELSITLAQKNIDDLNRNISLKELQIASANQSVEQAQQSVDLASQAVTDTQRQLDEATITAPFDGVVAYLLAEEGDIVPSPSMSPQPVVSLINPDRLELLIDVDEIDIPLVKLGQAASIDVDALPDESFHGTITSVYPVPQEESGVVLYKVRIALDGPASPDIMVGMSASADIVSQERRDVIIVPSRAITRDEQGRATVKVQTDGKVEERQVEVGLDDGLRAEITSGLSEGETVIVELKVNSNSNMSFF
jgi:HlyD family secretion protein